MSRHALPGLGSIPDLRLLWGWVAVSHRNINGRPSRRFPQKNSWRWGRQEWGKTLRNCSERGDLTAKRVGKIAQRWNWFH